MVDGAQRLIAEGHGIDFGMVSVPTDNAAADQVIASATSWRRYQLDGRHNWFSVKTDQATFVSEVDVENRYSQVLGQIPQYDSAGNLRAFEDASLTHDPFNQIATITANGVTTEIHRDGLGRIVGATDSLGRNVAWGYHGTARVATFETGGSASGSIRVLVPGGTIDQTLFTIQDGAITYLHQGRDNSPHVAMTGMGSVAEVYQYTAYGQRDVLDSSGSPVSEGVLDISFQGRPHLPLNPASVEMADFRHRTYLPTLGRFTSLDPIGILAGSNRYAFESILRGRRQAPPSVAFV